LSRASGSATSIRRRLLACLLPTLLALTIIGVFMNYRVAMVIVSSAYDQRLADAARPLGPRTHMANSRLTAQPLSAGALTSAAGVGAAAGPLGAARYSILDPQGRLIAGRSGLAAAPAGAGSLSYADARIGGENFRVATYRVQTALGVATANVAEPDAARTGPGHFIVASTWLMDFIQIDATLLIVWIAVHYGLRPLVAVRREIETRSVRDLEPLRVSRVPAEIRPLVDALNLLFDMLREVARSQRQFVADTAHQLRTPVAGLMGHLELLMRDPAAAPVRDRLSLLHEGMSRLAHAANQLLALARADPSVTVAERFERVALERLVEKVVELNVNRATQSGHDLGADVRPAGVSGNLRLLEDLLGNLVDNALDYTPAGGRVTVRCGITRRRAFLEVEDDGPGIPQAERMRVRQRFYRMPGTPGQGCGLGLAIVEEIARLHDAAVTLDSTSDGRGTRVRVEFPADA
jgi:two-component system, OmpR family, sensor histidine kinase TctE